MQGLSFFFSSLKFSIWSFGGLPSKTLQSSCVFKTLREMCQLLVHRGACDWINNGVARKNYLKSPNSSRKSRLRVWLWGGMWSHSAIGSCSYLQQHFVPSCSFIPSCNVTLVFSLQRTQLKYLCNMLVLFKTILFSELYLFSL